MVGLSAIMWMMQLHLAKACMCDVLSGAFEIQMVELTSGSPPLLHHSVCGVAGE